MRACVRAQREDETSDTGDEGIEGQEMQTASWVRQKGAVPLWAQIFPLLINVKKVVICNSVSIALLLRCLQTHFELFYCISCD